jgi:glycosyltransferase involved in cell wall biosynthesis
LRILYFTRDYTTHDRRFLVELAKTDHQVFFLRLERRGHPLEERPLPEKIEMIRWMGGQRPSREKDYPTFIYSLQEIIAQVQPDLIQAGPIQSCAYMVVRCGFHPLVSTSWGSDLLVNASHSRHIYHISRYVLRHSDVLVGDCDAVRQKAIDLGMRNEQIITFPWGIDLLAFPYQPPSPDPGRGKKFTLLSTRSWEAIYGVDVLARGFVRAVELLRQAQGDKIAGNLRLVMLGSGSKAKQIMRIFTQAGVLDQVDFPGQVTQDELKHYYGATDLYVATTHSDGTSISLLEAMASGRAVLVSDIPGNREWITTEAQPGEGVSPGWLFPDGDVEALAQQILRSFNEREHLTAMGLAGRKLVEQRADWQKNFPNLLKAYELAINVASGTHSSAKNPEAILQAENLII